MAERLARNTRVAQGLPEGDRRTSLLEMVERDKGRLADIRTAISRYGECVSDHNVPLSEDVMTLVQNLDNQGLRALLVGGSVRDSFSGTAPKDLDFEVYPADASQPWSMSDVTRAVRRHGRVNEVGKAFGVLKMTLSSGEEIDLSVPRRENKVGVGHRGFSVQVDPTLSVEEAAARRDFTVNAMSYDPSLRVLIDPHGGRADLEHGVLRHVSDAFDEDPLRVLRGMQFASRHGMRLDPATREKCRSLLSEASTLPVERVRVEWGKWSAKSTRPSAGLVVLRETGWDEHFSGLAAVNDERTRAEVDRMATVLKRDTSGALDPKVMLPAVVASRMKESQARHFLSQAVDGGDAQERALRLSRTQEVPKSAAQAREQALERAGTMRERAYLIEAQGGPGRKVYRLAEAAGVLDHPEADLLKGGDIMAHTSRKPGPWLGEIISEARLAQARGTFRTREESLVWLDQRL